MDKYEGQLFLLKDQYILPLEDQTKAIEYIAPSDVNLTPLRNSVSQRWGKATGDQSGSAVDPTDPGGETFPIERSGCKYGTMDRKYDFCF